VTDRWNRCDRFIPKGDYDVLLIVDGMYYIGHWDSELEDGHWYVYGMDSMFDMKPSHWRHLPERPRVAKGKRK